MNAYFPRSNVQTKESKRKQEKRMERTSSALNLSLSDDPALHSKHF